MSQPAYIQLGGDTLRAKVQKAAQAMSCCTLCPRECRVNRNEGETGFCRTGKLALVSSFNAHFGEEAPLVGQNGSGTISRWTKTTSPAGAFWCATSCFPAAWPAPAK